MSIIYNLNSSDTELFVVIKSLLSHKLHDEKKKINFHWIRSKRGLSCSAWLYSGRRYRNRPKLTSQNEDRVIR